MEILLMFLAFAEAIGILILLARKRSDDIKYDMLHDTLDRTRESLHKTINEMPPVYNEKGQRYTKVFMMPYGGYKFKILDIDAEKQ